MATRAINLLLHSSQERGTTVKVFNILKYVFGGVGLALLVTAFVLWNQTENFLRRSANAEGEVIDIVSYWSTSSNRSGSSRTRMHKPVVAFTTEKGKRVIFTSMVGSNPPTYRKGDKVQVAYDRSNPKEAKIRAFTELYLLPLIFGGIGSVFFTLGFAFWFVTFRKKRQNAFLRNHGQQVYATFVEVRINRNVRMNGRHPYQIVGEWNNPMNGEMHRFFSQDLWEDPTPYVPDELPVWIDPKNPRSHLMDLRYLPKQASS